MAWLPPKAAAERLGIHPVTLRRWADEGRVPVVRPGRERRFRSEGLDRFLGQAPKDIPRREALYVRVSGTPGQESSMAAQEEELRASSTGEVVGVFRNRASGLRGHRPGLDRLPAHAGEITVIGVTREDLPARFVSSWLCGLLAEDGVAVEAATPSGTGRRGGGAAGGLHGPGCHPGRTYVRDPLERGQEAAPRPSSAEGFRR
ncbi:MAG: IS607 family transposase [Candidatus Dormibacteria bacterium]